MMTKYIHAEELVDIHEILTIDFENSGDPVSPPGIRSKHLLESAASRQQAGFDGTLKYDTPYLNAATLCYGICCNHPFFNGNKRTALVATLCHLDRNDLMMKPTITQDNLYTLMIRVANHGFRPSGKGDQSDNEVSGIAKWLREATRRIDRQDKLLTYRELKSILNRYGFSLENPFGNMIDVVRQPAYWDGASERVIKIPYPRDGAVASRRIVKEVREACKLTEANGIDSTMFHANERPADYFVAKYRTTLRKLAKT
ncbi:type II toxin-antitoxin system death-on-curing family toxin [Paraburkholderia tropica]|uniref:type II toxin-antitoxin system death-on-curing family toxin n=1 Tax=Paraburkholderia tropica TaxID=92647 RepID=UPI002AB79C31|nr:type II toxin-antitoxin system death-on-curing family toxin [Paraburkholderia tropica]